MKISNRSILAAVAAAVLAMAGSAQAQDRSNVGSGTPAAKDEKSRGVPGVDVDVGKNAKGAIDVNVRKDNANEAPRGAAMSSTSSTGTSSTATATGTTPMAGSTATGDTGAMRAPRSDRG